MIANQCLFAFAAHQPSERQEQRWDPLPSMHSLSCVTSEPAELGLLCFFPKSNSATRPWCIFSAFKPSN